MRGSSRKKQYYRCSAKTVSSHSCEVSCFEYKTEPHISNFLGIPPARSNPRCGRRAT